MSDDNGSGNGNDEVDCCPFNVCLTIVKVEMTEEAKLQMKAIFSNICGDSDNGNDGDS